MAEAERQKQRNGKSHLRRTRSANAANLNSKCYQSKEKVERASTETLSSDEQHTKQGSSHLWVNPISEGSDGINENTLDRESPRLVKKLNKRPDSLCYEIQKVPEQKPKNEISGWPKCGTYHVCRGSGPSAFLVEDKSTTRRESITKNIAARHRAVKEEIKIRNKEGCQKFERPSTLQKKCGKDTDFALVVPPPPDPIHFTFSYHEDYADYSSDYRQQYTYNKFQSIQKSVKARQAQSRAKIVSMDLLAASKNKSVKSDGIGSFIDDPTKLISPDREIFNVNKCRRNSAIIPQNRKLFQLSCIQVQFNENDPRNKSLRKSDPVLSGISAPKPLSKCSDRSKGVFQSIPKNFPTRKSENNHKNSIAAKESKLIKSKFGNGAQPNSLPSSPKKMVCLKSKKTSTPPITRRKIY